MESKMDVTFDDEEEGEFVNWKVTDGAYVSTDAVLFTYTSKSDEKKSLKTSVSGVVTIDTTLKKGKVSILDVDPYLEFLIYIYAKYILLVKINK